MFRFLILLVYFVSVILVLDFEFVSDFVLRISNFRPEEYK
jgi:hypothetical protein